MKVAYENLKAGDRVTMNMPLRGRDTVHQTRTGKVVMRGPHGFVLNLGGPHGTPGIVDERNFVSATRRNG
jgi:hypothetical protein